MAMRRLTSIYSGFRTRTDLLLGQFSVDAPSPSCEVDGVPIEVLFGHSRSFLVNRLFHLWSEYCQQVVVASALGNCQTLNGAVLNRPSTIKSIGDIAPLIKEKSIAGPGLRWGDPVWTSKKLNRIKPANLQQISLGIGSAPYDEFRQVRNFVIHSNSNTRAYFDRVASGYSVFGNTADDLLLHKLPGGGTVMENWIRAFQDSALDAVR